MNKKLYCYSKKKRMENFVCLSLHICMLMKERVSTILFIDYIV